MAELNIKMTGDARGLTQSLSEASKAMSAAESKMVADARAGDAAVLASHKETAAKELALLKEQVAAAKEATKAKAGDEKAAAKEQVAALNEVVKAKKAALAEISRAERDAARGARDQQREAATQARREAAYRANGGAAGRGQPTGSGSDGEAGDLAGLGKGLITFGILRKVFQAMDAFAAKMDELNAKLDDTLVKADESRQNRIDSLRFAGFDKDTAKSLTQAGELSVSTKTSYRGSDLDAAFKALQSASGPIDAKEVQALLAKGDRLSLAGGAALVAQGFGGNQAVDLAGRYAAASGGTPLTPELAKLAAKYQNSKAFNGAGDLAGFLAASAATGITPGDNNPLADAAAQTRAQAQAAAQDVRDKIKAEQDAADARDKAKGGNEYQAGQKAFRDARAARIAAEDQARTLNENATGQERNAGEYDPLNRPFTDQRLFDEYTIRRQRAGAGPLKGRLSSLQALHEQTQAQAEFLANEGDHSETFNRLDEQRMRANADLVATQTGDGLVRRGVAAGIETVIPGAQRIEAATRGTRDRPLFVQQIGQRPERSNP